ncbi:AfsR/SARP family transcriptional regulator (plasmid) [Streptomyces sp. NBC_01267]|uniref:AfsR/SARP family transcriptional regulator n=1 Tax=unclassified Streptomyces TaxID=2593676 RepID=UPI002023DC42|nr:MULTISPECIES: AfsR/SARP family transcriptional regulator [unclassified Streptomyces]MCX4554449.1 AfsR/SARP family transcriptional regulator [Streptomyces sp. NBC_01500]WSV58951.1 AfsR/SARP family transcriptional regulator [Streptomyces sp. NBC_01014]
MDIEILGVLSVREGLVPVVPTAPKPRQVLALLALRADRVVASGELIENLWGDSPPGSARTTVQTYVMGLRDLIGSALTRAGETSVTAKDVLVTVDGGYRLDTRGGTVDFREFERRAGLGYRAMDAEDYRGAADRLRHALSLWTGPVLADVPLGRPAARDAGKLEEARLTALGQRIEADLRLGRHRDLLPELTALVSRFPAREETHGQFALALHRSGRRGEALRVCERLRGTLAREQGREPSAGFSGLQRLIVTAPETAAVRGPAG